MKKLTSFIVFALFIVGMVSVSMLPGSQESEETVFLATSTKIISTTPIKWFSCAAPVLDNEWYYNPGYATISCNGVNYVGNFGAGGSISSPAFNVGAHQGILVSLNLMLLDTWVGESFKVKADGKEVYSQTHTYPVSGINNCGLMGPYSIDMYQTITFGFNHTASTLSLVFTSTLNQDKSLESWGICDLTITASATPVQANARPMPTLSETPQTWFNCVDGRIDVAWTYNPQHMVAKCNGMYYIGNYGWSHFVRSPAYPVAPHKGIIVSLKLMLLDSWESEYFQVKADGVQVYSLQWSYGQATSNTCGQDWNDAYKTITFGFNHTASTVSFLLTSTLNEDRMDESWGVCDFTVSTTQHRVNADGQILPDLSENPVTFMPCTTAAQENTWSYTPGYTSITCNNLKYTGNFGAREYIISPALTVAPHQGIIVSLKLALLDSWDGESFFVKANDIVVYSYRWIEEKGPSNTCGYRWKDAYPSVTFGFNHTASTVTFVLYSTLDQGKTDESWGICDFTVTATPYQVTYEGKPKTN